MFSIKDFEREDQPVEHSEVIVTLIFHIGRYLLKSDHRLARQSCNGKVFHDKKTPALIMGIAADVVIRSVKKNVQLAENIAYNSSLVG